MNDTIADNIWITAKTRMFTEARYRSYNLLANVWITTCSLLLIFFSLFTDEISAVIHHADRLNIALSIAVLALSLVLSGFRFLETAAQHRECYIKLQALYETRGCNQNLAKEYNAILDAYPNHDDQDYDNLVIDRAIFRDKPITDPKTKEPIKPTTYMIVRKSIRTAILLIASYLLPAMSLIALVKIIWR
ncbi:SLATT domain-containing protein [Azospirillum sp. 11R-A]|uniref:SLATT domain-containing protein n=1 Tax=Azospirillum sp. 11R-A TaxID=3111634 RepID=UPI003C1F8A0B